MPKYRTYNRNSLSRINQVYLADYSHHINLSDVHFANQCIKLMYAQLNDRIPHVGDVVQYTAKDGTYFPHAHIDQINNGTAVVCLNPFVPFIEEDPQGGLVFFSVSGGPWVEIPVAQLRYDGSTTKQVRFFGSSGICAHGAIDFHGYAKAWSYEEDGLLFGSFSTKDYQRIVLRKYEKKWYLSECKDPENFPDKEYNIPTWVAERYGTQFGDFNRDDVITIFAYKEHNHLVKQQDWLKMDLPQSVRQMNHSTVPVKVSVDHQKKSIDVFRYTNC